MGTVEVKCSGSSYILKLKQKGFLINQMEIEKKESRVTEFSGLVRNRFVIY